MLPLVRKGHYLGHLEMCVRQLGAVEPAQPLLQDGVPSQPLTERLGDPSHGDVVQRGTSSTRRDNKVVRLGHELHLKGPVQV